MLSYKFTMTGNSLEDGEMYKSEVFCEGMSQCEKESWIKESNFDSETVTITKEKSKKK